MIACPRLPACIAALHAHVSPYSSFAQLAGSGIRSGLPMSALGLSKMSSNGNCCCESLSYDTQYIPATTTKTEEHSTEREERKKKSHTRPLERYEWISLMVHQLIGAGWSVGRVQLSYIHTIHKHAKWKKRRTKGGRKTQLRICGGVRTALWNLLNVRLAGLLPIFTSIRRSCFVFFLIFLRFLPCVSQWLSSAGWSLNSFYHEFCLILCRLFGLYARISLCLFKHHLWTELWLNAVCNIISAMRGGETWEMVEKWTIMARLITYGSYYYWFQQCPQSIAGIRLLYLPTIFHKKNHHWIEPANQ